MPRILPIRKPNPRFMSGLTFSVAQEFDGSGEGESWGGRQRALLGQTRRAGKWAVPHRQVFVSVASKGLRVYVSGLESTLLARGYISVAAKGLMWAKCWRESNGLGGKIFKELEGSSMNL